ncbi:hypothetical protein [Spiroplasma floricola]|uniref:hypothetical protein n=1 Tax=Spiroplasma floricola TaxID=216937 RepID=UPI003CCBF0AE
MISAIMHKLEFLVLDEPTRGLDLAISIQFYDLILKFKNDFKTTIIICSHEFNEVLKLCDRVGFIKQGVLIKEYNTKETNMKEIQEDFVKLFKNHSVEDLF